MGRKGVRLEMGGRGDVGWSGGPESVKKVESCVAKMELQHLDLKHLDPEHFLKDLAKSYAPLAKRLALATSWPVLKGFLPAAVQREDAEAALRQLSHANLEKLAKDPKRVLQSTLESGPLATKFVVAWGMAQVRSTLEPSLPPGVLWADMEFVFQGIKGVKLADIKAAARDPEGLRLSCVL